MKTIRLIKSKEGFYEAFDDTDKKKIVQITNLEDPIIIGLENFRKWAKETGHEIEVKV